MEVIEKSFNDIDVMYPIDKICDIDKILFFDIETTGFSAKTSNLYMIGCMYHRDNEWKTIQYFAENYSDEKELVEEFFALTKDFNTLIHFNGNNFDIPYVLDKCKQYDIAENFDHLSGIDIYKRIKPYRNLLKLENCKQKTVEAFLKIDRDDRYSGGDLISVYHSYVSDHSEDNKNLLILHNYDDLRGMLRLLPVLSYSDLYNEKLKVTKVSANYYNDEAGVYHTELLMVFDINTPLPEPISSLVDGCYFTGNGNQGLIKVPLFEGELKYFYSNYHDYYYLPSEDMAIHKSVAEFVDKNHREKATARNCYTKKSGLFLKEYGLLVTPFFKVDYDSKDVYFELTEEMKKDRELFSQYASHILQHIAAE